ncbi:protein tyrosine kinase domain-containing protein [Phthorimaea operculella]|nr:protein tyrosine kinase domain-containing protein [Phthorimaea operculella]
MMKEGTMSEDDFIDEAKVMTIDTAVKMMKEGTMSEDDFIDEAKVMTIDTAVKMMKEGTMSEDDFIDEAKVMTKLQHQNLVQLYGVCSKHRPIYIVTEYMRHGSLLKYLQRHRNPPDTLGPSILLDMCIQVCKGMAYLERHNYIHRDLAARNCLVGDENVVKVADFGLARYVLDDQYTSSGGTKFPIKWAPPEVLNYTRFSSKSDFPIKWAPPEVLNYTRFSSKSDVWAFGVLMWEVFTCGKVPYPRMKNSDVVEMVQRGQVLEKPKGCNNEIYNVSTYVNVGGTHVKNSDVVEMVQRGQVLEKPKGCNKGGTHMKNSDVVEMVQRGQVLEKPKGCNNEIYNVSTYVNVGGTHVKNSDVVEMVQRGQVLEKPKGCNNEIYNVSTYVNVGGTHVKNSDVVEMVQRGQVLEKPKGCNNEIYNEYLC